MHEQAFLKACFENQNDWLTFSQYADWLDEQGKPSHHIRWYAENIDLIILRFSAYPTYPPHCELWHEGKRVVTGLGGTDTGAFSNLLTDALPEKIALLKSMGKNFRFSFDHRDFELRQLVARFKNW